MMSYDPQADLSENHKGGQIMKVSSRLFWVLGVVLVALAIPFSAQAGDGQIKIGQTSSTTFPVILDKPGSYVLTSNL